MLPWRKTRTRHERRALLYLGAFHKFRRHDLEDEAQLRERHVTSFQERNS